MKKVFGIILIIVMAFTFASCGKVEEQNNENIDGDKVVILQENARVYLYDVQKKAKELIFDHPTNDAVLDGDYLYIADQEWNLFRYNLKTSDKEYLIEKASDYIYINEIMAKGVVYTTSSMEEGGKTHYIDFKTKKDKVFLDNAYGIYRCKDNILGVYYGDNGEEIISINPETDIVSWVSNLNDTMGPIETSDGKLFYLFFNEDQYKELNMETGEFTPVNIETVGYNLKKDDEIYSTLYCSKDELITSKYDSEAEKTVIFRRTPAGETTLDFDGEYIFVKSRYSDYLVFTAMDTYYGYDDESETYSVIQNYLYKLGSGTLEKIDNSGKYYDLFKDDEFPILDSSTARIPVTNRIYQSLVLEKGGKGTAPICSTTHKTWLGLADGLSDICLLAAPTDEEKAYLESKGVEVEMKLYGGDGLVFIGSSECGVTDLTIDQIRGIYSGEITNWKELGGVDHEIAVIYREDQSGSQRLFDSMIFKDGAPDYEKLGFTMYDTMASAVNNIKYTPYSIGYTIMTYLGDFFGNEYVSRFSIEGVESTKENVANGTYKLGTRGYVVIRADEEENSPARRLYNLFGTTFMDEILNKNGVTPLSE